MAYLAVVSGGMDSAVLAYWLQSKDMLGGLITFDYGQRHAIEIDYARKIASRLGAPHVVIDLRALSGVITGTSLTDSAVNVPEGHYAEATMRQTVVPHRNAIMLMIASSVAASKGLDGVATAVHAGDHFVYPDCRPAFIKSLGSLLEVSGGELTNSKVLAPFVNMKKAGLVLMGGGLAVPFEDTWSCYKGESIHCGRCGTCVERQEAFDLAEMKDPTVYADPDFWKKVCNVA